ncbi:hypothetical protein [Gilvimarinus japonicus]|uniref:Uncharacterized protein n=1 Tax=Gilvimarinus japonicus TaxID=1796469 RepID=A0ABV7HR73_9GAMM
MIESLNGTEMIALCCVLVTGLWQLFLTVLMFSFRRVLREHDELKKSHFELQLAVVRDYATKIELSDSVTRIETLLNQLFNDVHRSNNNG